MNQQFIQNMWIDWSKVDEDSYLRDIPALQFEDKLVFEHNITFFVGENGTGKSTLYILDEPEAALSPQRQLTLLIQIAKMAKEGAQFIIATHSPILLGIPGADILSFDEGVLHRCEYEQTESYQVMEMFINNREYFLKRLLGE